MIEFAVINDIKIFKRVSRYIDINNKNLCQKFYGIYAMPYAHCPKTWDFQGQTTNLNFANQLGLMP